MRTKITAFILVVAAVLAGAPAAGADLLKSEEAAPKPPATLTDKRSDARDWDRIARRIPQGGTAPVMVGLDVPTRPEGTLKDAEVKVQRAAIATATKSVLAALKPTRFTVRNTYRTLPFMSVEVSRPALEVLRRSPHVLSVGRVRSYETFTAQSVPLVGGERLAQNSFQGQGAMVAVLDTGVETTHPMLNGRVVEEACTARDCDVTNADGTVTYRTGPGTGGPCTFASATDCDHGTHVASIAAGAAVTIGGNPVMGVARAVPVMSIRTASSPGMNGRVQNWNDDITQALDHVALTADRRTIAAVNMSFGGGNYPAGCGDATFGAAEEGIKNGIANLASRNIASVVSSGNNGSPGGTFVNGIAFPACAPYAIAVGNTTLTDTVTASSQAGWNLQLLAPGTNIRAAGLSGTTAIKTGTSMAAPHVAGAFALARQVANIPWYRVRDVLKETGVRIRDTRNNTTYSRIQACSAIDKLMVEYRGSSIAGMCSYGPSGFQRGPYYQPNNSVFIYGPSSTDQGAGSGLGVTGTVVDGVFYERASFGTGPWTHAAVSSDSLLMYNSNTGAAEVGTLIDGVYTPRVTTTLGAGWTHVTASCDSYLLYKNGWWGQPGRGETGVLRNGTIEYRESSAGYYGGWQQVSSSCDTVQFIYTSNNGGWDAWGTLTNGVFRQTGQVWNGYNSFTHLANTTYGFLQYSRWYNSGQWGASDAGSRSVTGSTSGFSTWDVISGAGNSVVFYNRSSGVVAFSTIGYGGQYTYRGWGYWRTAWEVIAGGK